LAAALLRAEAGSAVLPVVDAGLKTVVVVVDAGLQSVVEAGLPVVRRAEVVLLYIEIVFQVEVEEVVVLLGWGGTSGASGAPVCCGRTVHTGSSGSAPTCRHSPACSYK